MVKKILHDVKVEGKHKGYGFFCPGCKFAHIIPIEGPKSWGFNGNVDKPTFSPSILVTTPYAYKKEICHSFVTDGMIDFLGDCTHDKAGQKLPLIPTASVFSEENTL